MKLDQKVVTYKPLVYVYFQKKFILVKEWFCYDK